MGILQSVLQYWSSHTDEEENYDISSVINSYNNDEKLEYIPRHDAVASTHHKWQRGGDHSVLSNQTKYLTVSVPNLREPSSLIHTSVNKKAKSSIVLIKQNTPQNVYDGGRTGSGEKGEEKQREGGAVMVECKVVGGEGRWMKHYSSCQRILLVGEGDFSFSTCLAASFGLASNMIATSLDSEAFLVKNYQNAISNIVQLSIRKCRVMHEIDATKMANHPILGKIKFDRIVFNFPFAGIFKMPRDSRLRLHRRLVSKFLMNAKEMISESGEIHITLKTSAFQMEWKVESMASSHRLRLVEAVDFNHLEYPGYNTKSGFGGDDNFYCYPSKTYKFGLKSPPLLTCLHAHGTMLAASHVNKCL